MTHSPSSAPAQAMGNISSPNSPDHPNTNTHLTSICSTAISMQPMDSIPQNLVQWRTTQGTELPPPTLEALLPKDSPASLSLPLLPNRARILFPAVIIPFSILGLLIRLGLVSIETFAGQQVFSLAWPQFVGCVLMGLFASTRTWIDGGNTSTGHWIGPFVYVGLTSGLCGSITTFSSWSLALFIELININHVTRHPLQNILSALTELVVTLALAISGLQLGTHLGETLIHLASDRQVGSSRRSFVPPDITSCTTALTGVGPTLPASPPPLPPSRWTILDALVASITATLWVGVICAAIWMPLESLQLWRHVVLACCFAPAGAILRWYLSRFNSRSKLFPFGTFAANLGGSIVLAAIYCLQHSSVSGQRSSLACHVLSGLQDGFCGCLTTISTFALEVKTLPRRASYVYGVVSVVITQISMLLMVGSYIWTRNSPNPQESTMACTP
ncbi:MAG: CrcB-like protein-domain-containing protein [Linnemannia gamsii]|nr:MAG: CrcB-like protein-domain-containing protein [Linnemannia gamsii]